MAGRYGAGRKRQRYSVNSSFLEDSLLSQEERALYELDQTFIRDVTKAKEDEEPPRKTAKFNLCLRSCGRRCSRADKGLLSLLAMFCLAVMGVAILILARWRNAGLGVDLLGQYMVSAGIFGLASGGTNWLAVVGLFYKIPGFIGSGVFYRRHKQIQHVVKLIVLQIVFDTQHLETYLARKIAHFSSTVQVVDSINSTLSSQEAERVIEERLDILYVQPEGEYLKALGLSKQQFRPLIKPAVLSLYSEAAPLVLDDVAERRRDRGISVPQFREEMDRFLSARVEAVTEREIGKQMRRHMFRHFSWIVVWGSIFGLLTGIVVQALHISLNFDIIQPS